MAIAATLLGSAEGTTSSANKAITATSTNGATWVVFAACDTSASWGATPITDNKGNTYTQIGTNVTAFGVISTLWYKDAGTGGATHTITATPSTNALISLIVVEITGGAAGILDKSATGNDDAASPFTSTATATTTQANEVVLAFEYDNRSSGTAITWGNSYTGLVDLSNVSGISCAAAKLNVTATGAQQSSFTNAQTTEAVSYIATFKEAAAAGGGGPLTGGLIRPALTEGRLVA